MRPSCGDRHWRRGPTAPINGYSVEKSEANHCLDNLFRFACYLQVVVDAEHA
jgi:hypothetical protein